MSSNKGLNNIIILLAVLLLIPLPVMALEENFQAFSSKNTINVCTCDMTEQELTIQNTGQVTSTYILEQAGKASNWSNLAPQTFYLEPGQTKRIENFIKVPCKARGDYMLNTTIRTLFEKEKTLEQTVHVENCPNVQILPKFSGIQEECPCTPVQYDFEVVNTGKHIETYELSVESESENVNPDAISLSQSFLVMEPGEKQPVTVFINLNCGEYGEKTFTLNALAQGTKILGQMEFHLDIKKCYDYNLEIEEEEYAVCQGVENTIPFTINNNASISNEYFLEVKGSGWISYPESISAAGKERRESQLNLIPPLEEEGIYEINVKSLSARGEETREKQVRLISEKCYDYQIFGEELIGIQCKERTAQLGIKNIGSRRTTYWMETEGPGWAQLENQKLSLEGGEEGIILFDINAPCEAGFEEYMNTLFVTIEQVNETYSQEHNIRIIPREDAFLPDIDTTTLVVGYEGGSGDVEITNRGLLPAKYKLDVAGPNWVSISPESLELQAGETGNFVISAYPTNETEQDGYKTDIIATVQEESIEYSTGLIIEVKKEKTLMEKLEENLLWIIIGGSILILIIIILIVVALVKKSKKKKPIVKKKEEPKEEKKIDKKPVKIDKKQYSKQKKKEKGKNKWPAILAILLIILLLGTGAFFAYKIGSGKLGDTGTERNETEYILEDAEQPVEEFAEEVEKEPVEKKQAEEEVLPEPSADIEEGKITEEDIQESLITLDRTDIPGKENELIVTNETELNMPMMVTNPTDRNAIMSIENKEGSWIEFEREKFTVRPQSTEKINVKVRPNYEILKTHDYNVKMNASLEGKKISYQEELEFEIKTKTDWLSWLLWAGAGILALILLLGIMIAGKKREGKKEKKGKKKAAKKKTKKKKEKKPKKSANKPKKKKRKEEGSLWLLVLGIILAALIVGAMSFWVYNTFQAGDKEDVEEDIEEEVPEPEGEAEEVTGQTDEEPVELEEKEEFDEPTEENIEKEQEPKLTEEDIQESLVTIDRSGVPGEGAVLELEEKNYTLPLSVKNPTDKTAKFLMNTGNGSWIRFDEEKIVVEPESTKESEMKIVPDHEKLKTHDYKVTIDTTLAGEKIDYEERLEFVITEKNGRWPWWAWALTGLVILGIIILASEIIRRNKEDIRTKKKNSKMPKKQKKGKKKAAKKKTKKKKGKKRKDKEDYSDIDKEIEKIRKRSMLKIKKK